LLDFIDDAQELAFGHRPLEAGSFEAGEDARSVPRHPPAVFFDDDEPDRIFDALVGGESLRAVEAFAPAADRAPALAGARVDDLQALLVRVTERAMHPPTRLPFPHGNRKKCWRRGSSHCPSSWIHNPDCRA